MKKTSICHLMKGVPRESDLAPTKDRFIVLKTFVQESHLFRYLLKCKECGQLYFFEFYEEIDWIEGKDPQYTTYIPVKTSKEAGELNKKSQLDLLRVVPQLRKDFVDKQTIKWIYEV